MLFEIHSAKLIHKFRLHSMNQQGSPCCHNWLTVPPSYFSKVISIGALNADKIAEAVWLYAFPLFLFKYY